MSQKKIVDNAAQVFAAMAAFVLEAAPRGLRKHDRAELETYAESSHELLRDTATMRFERGEASVELDVQLGKLTWERVEQEGDLYREVCFKAELGHYSASRRSPASMLLSAALANEVALFAAELLERYAGTFYQLVATKDERAAAALANEHKNFLGRLRAGVENHMQGKRSGVVAYGVDARNFLEIRDREQLPPAGVKFAVTAGKKQFEVEFGAYNQELESDTAGAAGPGLAWPSCKISRIDGTEQALHTEKRA